MKGVDLFTWSGGVDGPVTTNGTSDPFTCVGGTCKFAAVGAFGGGTVKLQSSFDNGVTWIDVPMATFTVRSVVTLYLPPCLLQTVISGAASPVVETMMVGLPDQPF